MLGRRNGWCEVSISDHKKTAAKKCSHSCTIWCPTIYCTEVCNTKNKGEVLYEALLEDEREGRALECMIWTYCHGCLT